MRKNSRKAKQEIALALAVSLWIAGGWYPGTASAEVTVTSKEDAAAKATGDGAVLELKNSIFYTLKSDEEEYLTIAGGDYTAVNIGFAARFKGANEGNASEGTLTVNDGLFNYALYGGYSKEGSANYNHLIFIKGNNSNMIYGGYGATGAAGNTVEWRGGEVSIDITGGYTENGVAGGDSAEKGNKVIISGGKADRVYGGYSSNGEAKHNMVSVSGNAEVGNVYGGYSSSNSAKDNVVDISGGKITDGIYGGYSNKIDKVVSGNKVTISGEANLAESVTICGGYMRKSGTAKNNIVTLARENLKVTDIYAGYTEKATGVTSDNQLILQATGIEAINEVGANIIKLGSEVEFAPGTTVIKANDFTIGIKDDSTMGTLDISEAAGLNKATLGTMTLLQSGTVNDFATLPLKYRGGETTLDADHDTQEVYSASGLTTELNGVTLDYNTRHNVSINLDGANTYQKVTYTAVGDVTKLTFGNVEWKDTGAILTGSDILRFNGAAVDTTKINFTNIKSLGAGKKMTLVSDFGDTVGTITGTEYTVGTTLKGKGQASLADSDGDGTSDDLIFTAETGTTQEQTHNTLMGAAAGMAALSAGNDFVGAAAEGISLASNTGADGLATYANMGGGSLRQETGSYVDAHTWNAILAIGHRNAKERSTLDYGAFFEYGRGNYTTINGDHRGDGNTHYTGGGLMGKYALKNGVYAEASLRAGRMTDNASNVLRDALGNAYSYKTSTPYYGFHLGVGKVFDLGGGKTVDLYGKYFYNHRNSVSFNAGGQYDLDAVNSQLLRLGARYTLKRDSWNYYAGLAYEYELDGKATGTADGVAIRAASTKGGSLRGELGATFRPSEDSPWNIDLNVSGFAGKKRGVTGGVSVAYMF